MARELRTHLLVLGGAGGDRGRVWPGVPAAPGAAAVFTDRSPSKPAPHGQQLLDSAHPAACKSLVVQQSTQSQQYKGTPLHAGLQCQTHTVKLGTPIP